MKSCRMARWFPALIFAAVSVTSCSSGDKKKSLRSTVVFSSLGGDDSSSLALASESTRPRGPNHPEIEGIKIRVSSVGLLCKDPDSDSCFADVLFFPEAREIILSGQEAIEVDLSDANKPFEIVEREYYAARLAFSKEYAVKVKYYDEEADKTVYTTTDGIQEIEGDASDPEGWDYLEFPEIFSGSSGIVQESNYFSTPFVYEGGDLSVRVIMDVRRAGWFYGGASESEVEWGLHNFSTYVMLNQDVSPSVETYVVSSSQEGLETSAQFIHLVFNAEDEFFGGSGQGANTPEWDGKKIYPFLRDFECASTDNRSNCSFKTGAPEVAPDGSDDTYEDGFVQSASGFRRLEIGESDSCQMTGTDSPETLYYRRIPR